MGIHLILGCLGVFLLSGVLGVVLTPLAARLARRCGLVDAPGTRKIHARAMPYGGGIAIFLTLAVVVTAAWLVAWWMPQNVLWSGLVRAIDVHRKGLFASSTLLRFAGLAGGALLIFLMGLVDDRWGLSARVKLAVQIIAAFLLPLTGTQVTLFVGDPFVGIVITMLWVVLITNSFNLLDNMDGLSGGVALIAAGFFFVVAVQAEQVFVSALLAALMGALASFLIYNFSPARLFMGDAGSLFVGYLLSSLTVAATYYREQGGGYEVLMPVLILGVPLFDTASVIVIRTLRGTPIMQGDTNHLSHRLVRMGLTKRGAVLTIYLLGMILGAAAVLLRQLDMIGALVVGGIGVGVVLLMTVLMCAAARTIEETRSDV